jgi:spermidine/putrescine transport system substrate-binding protein
MMDIRKTYEALAQRHGDGDLDRRGFLAGIGRMAAACGMVGLAPLASCSDGPSGPSVRFDGFGGVAQSALSDKVFRPFSLTSGVAVRQGSYANSDELLTKIQAEGLENFNYWDCGSEFEAKRFLDYGYLESLDESRIPALANLMPKTLESYRLGEAGLVAVPTTLTGVLVAYNTDRVDGAEVRAQGSNILLNPAYRQGLAGEDNWIKRIWYAAVQSGQDPNDIQDMSLIWDKIRESRDVVFKYWATGAEQMQLLASGNAILSDAWIMRVHALKRQGLPIEGYQPPGFYIGVSAVGALKGAPMDPFYEMMDILLRPSVLNAISIARGTPPALDASRFEVPDEIRSMPGFDATGQLAGVRIMDPTYWTTNARAWSAEYRRVMARG